MTNGLSVNYYYSQGLKRVGRGIKNDIGSNFKTVVRKIKKKGQSSVWHGGAVRRRKRSLRRAPGDIDLKTATKKEATRQMQQYAVEHPSR